MEIVALFLTKAVVEAAGAAMKLVAERVAPGASLVGDAAASVSKDLVGALLERTSSIEDKLDALLAEPLRSGLQLLSDALVHSCRDDLEVSSRDSLLDNAHQHLVRAQAVAANDREGFVLIRAIDCIALVCRTGRVSLAEKYLRDANLDILVLRERVHALEDEARMQERDVRAMSRFFGRDNPDYESKPHGYDVQILFARYHENAAKRVIKAAEQARARLTILETVVGLTERLLPA